MPAKQPCKLAVIAAANAQSAGISPNILPFIQTIITALFPQWAPLINGCLPSPTPAGIRQMLTNKYNRRKSRYAPGVLNKAVRATEDQASAIGQQIDEADAETITICTLDAFRLGSDDDIQEVMSAHS